MEAMTSWSRVHGLDHLIQSTRIHRRLYTDPGIFEAELRSVFGRTWVFIGCESEIAQPGDYKSTYIGRQPVILSRSLDHEIHVLMNRCMHRGALICRGEYGNTSSFTCMYHGWTYDAKGRLLGMPYKKGYGTGFDRQSMDLVKAPRVVNYRGLIFASLNTEIEDFETYLGGARRYLDLALDASPDGAIAIGPGQVNSYTFNANWKLQVENLVDGYHPNFTHESAFELFARSRGEKRGGSVEASGAKSLGLGHGHCVLDFTGVRNAIWGRVAAASDEYVQRLTARWGSERAREVLGADLQILLFPNFFLQSDRQQFRVIRPLGVNRTEVRAYSYRLPAAPDALNQLMFKESQRWSSAGGIGQPDDLEAFERCQEGLAVEAADWVIIARGVDREQRRDGEVVGDITDEVPHREIYRAYKELLSQAGPEAHE
jgi:benzoate/toluate 1,2-dioxygenase subunit alpha